MFKHPRLPTVFLWIAACCSACWTARGEAPQRWPVERAAAWQARHPWLVGCNFIPSSAANQLEMWQADSFDPATIDRELGWAHGLGLNSVRVFLHNLVWEHDRAGLIQRMDRFLALAQKHRIGVVFVPLDGCWDPQPRLGKQPDPVPHLHNSRWLQAPGAAILNDPQRHERLRGYIVGVIGHFRDDPRVDAWDLFNEPDNPNGQSYGASGKGTELSPERKAQMATLLLEKAFSWARAAGPSQPLTAGLWQGDWSKPDALSPINRLMLEQSDVLSFHGYGNLEAMRRSVEALKAHRRPVLCTEYMSRGSGCTFDPVLGYLKQQRVGAYHWGLVAGKTQTQYPWESWRRRFTAEPEVWFHDVLRPDGTPFDPAEVKFIREATGKERRGGT